MPLELERLHWLTAAAIFVVFGAAVVALGLWSLGGLGPVRKWTAIGVRLLVLAMLVLVLGGAKWERKHKDVEVILLKDSSTSVDRVSDYPGKGKGVGSVEDAIRRYYADLANDPTKKPDDRLGLVSFRHYARVDAQPTNHPQQPGQASWVGRPGAGTDVASAIQLALVTFNHDAMQRLVLVSDGRSNLGDLDAAVRAAKSQGVPIDVVPLRYDVQRDVMVEGLTAPEWKRQNEAFNVNVKLKSTNAVPVEGTLRVKHVTAGGEADLDVDPATPGLQPTRRVTLKPGMNSFEVPVPAQQGAGVHRFKAIFVPDDPSAGGVAAAAGTGDAVAGNNTADAFTVVRGKGQVLFVDGSLRPGAGGQPEGDLLFRTLGKELSKSATGAVEADPVRRVPVDQFPRALVDLQNYYAIVLYNVSRGGAVTEAGNVGGITPEQDAMLRSYVHDLGGGLFMVGGPDTFGAGGWQGSEVEKVLPVNMDVPAKRNVGKGALALIIHSCEMPDGNYWGQRCAIEAIKTLSSRDEVGVISYGWGGGAGGNGIGGAAWDVPMQELRDRDGVIDAVKRMNAGDMPSFDDAVNLAVNGAPGGRGLKHVRARHKHMIIISDGDPTAPQETLLRQCESEGITVSTITVYPHQPGQKKVPPVMEELPKRLGGKDGKGKFYGPIEADQNQLPQIFIKEAQIVKRTLIQEAPEGLPMANVDAGDEVLRQALVTSPKLPALYGLILTTRKNDPKVLVPLSSGTERDPVLAYWQSGLGRAAVWTSDADHHWAKDWVGTEAYASLFTQIVRKVSRPPQTGEFDVRTEIVGDKGVITVEAVDKDAAFRNFVRMTAGVIGGDDLSKPQNVQLVQIGPGTYRGEFSAREGGPYIAAVSANGESPVFGGTVKNGTLEDRDLSSDEAALANIAQQTGGRMLPAFDPANAHLFDRVGLTPGASSKPIWDILLPILLALIILDVALRRLAWDWESIKRAAAKAGEWVRSFTHVRKVASEPTMDALRKVREDVADAKFKQGEATAGAGGPPPVPTGERPDPRAKFEPGKEVEGDITDVVGGATNKPVPPGPKNAPPPKGGPAGGHIGGLMAAKRRAQQEIKDKEQEGEK